MQWVERFLDRLDLSLEWQSPGKLAWRFSEEEGWLRMPDWRSDDDDLDVTRDITESRVRD
jgi:hypothetical protein